MILLIKLFIAHLLGDFILQPKSWVSNKERLKWKSPFLYVHTLVHFGLILLITWNWDFWRIALIIALSHLLIDGIKLQFQVEIKKPIWFAADQLMHIQVLYLVWKYCIAGETTDPALWPDPYWYLAAGFIFVTYPSGQIIKTLMMPWSRELERTSSESLPMAGLYIGILERLLVLTFIIVGEWQVVGFVLAAKSIFRFSDLTRAKDRKLTEYILLGTLLSFSIAIWIGLLIRPFLL